MSETTIAKQGNVFTEFIGDQHIFQRFSFLSDLHFTIMIAALVILIVFDKIAVEFAFFRQYFFYQDQCATGIETIVNTFQ